MSEVREIRLPIIRFPISEAERPLTTNRHLRSMF